MHPKTRTNPILAHPVAGELVLYDRDRQQAHRLNPLAARVYALSDAGASVSDIVTELGRDPTLAVDESIVLVALGQLRAAGLLEGAAPTPVHRREAIKKVAAVAAAVALPVVVSIAAPTPAMAASGETCPPGTIPVNTTSGTVCTPIENPGPE